MLIASMCHVMTVSHSTFDLYTTMTASVVLVATLEGMLTA